MVCWLDLQLLLPHRVFLLRGNHETKFCTSAYGFEQEIMSKFGDRAKHLYRKLLGCFEGHPLAARVAGCVYMAHGGLFRQVEKEVPKTQKGKSSRYVHSENNQTSAHCARFAAFMLVGYKQMSGVSLCLLGRGRSLDPKQWFFLVCLSEQLRPC